MRRALVPLAALVVAVVACSKNAGDACDFFDERCADARTELACRDGKLVAAPCHGPRGCWGSGSGDRHRCDVSGNAAGDPCGRSGADREIQLLLESHAACTAKDEMLACVGGAYASFPCRGGCNPDTSPPYARCDVGRGLAREGDACIFSGPRGLECGEDVLLECKAGKLAFKQACKGCDLGGTLDGVHVSCIRE